MAQDAPKRWFLSLMFLVSIIIIVNEKWYEHVPEPVLESEGCKILWDFMIQTDHVIEARRPDMIVVKKRNKCCKIIDFTIPYDSRIEEKEVE